MRKYKAVKLAMRLVSVLNPTPCKMWTAYRQLIITAYEHYTCLCVLSVCVSLSLCMYPFIPLCVWIRISA